MSVEQTTQLIQLLLNSVLMVMASVIALGSLLMRHNTLREGLRACHREYVEDLKQSTDAPRDRSSFKRRLQVLVTSYQTSYASVQVLYVALGCFALSTLSLSLRTFLQWNGFISVSLGLFVLGTGLLLLGVGLALLEFYRSRRHLQDELTALVGVRDKRPISPKRRKEKLFRQLPPASGG